MRYHWRMRWPWQKRAFVRREVVAAADLDRARGRRTRAIAGYRRALAEDPDDLAVHAKIAPLLAAGGERAAALQSFRAAADGQARAGFHERALALLIHAAEHFPDEEPLWPDIARLHLQRGRRAEAVSALTAGGWRLCLLRRLDVAERVLRLAVDLDPADSDAQVILARILARAGRRDEALRLLDAVLRRERGRRRTAVRGVMFRIAPSPGRLWGWLRGLAGRG
jgi:tetratricopeptide (TPR) repeat protein